MFELQPTDNQIYKKNRDRYCSSVMSGPCNVEYSSKSNQMITFKSHIDVLVEPINHEVQRIHLPYHCKVIWKYELQEELYLMFMYDCNHDIDTKH